MRIGNKVDAFNPLENKYHVSKKIIRVLLAKEWSFVVQTRFPYTLWNFTTFDWDRFRKFGTVLVVITPGRDLDWEIMEGKKTHTTLFRLEALKNFQEVGVPVGVQGEPYIPGFHTPSMFEETLKLLKSYGVKSYTTYNFHFTPFVAKRLAELRDPRVDVEKIWYYNQDKEWRKILRELLDIAKRLGIRMGCPDFVNSGRKHVEPFNTCCGINVSNPCTFNTHYFKRFAQQGMSLDRILSLTNDGTGNYENALSILNGNTESEFYTLRDAGVLPKGVK
jgi:DNA repair photolyase